MRDNAGRAEQLPRITPYAFRHAFVADRYLYLKSCRNWWDMETFRPRLGIYTSSYYERVEAEFFWRLSIESALTSTGDHAF